jgi:hypothetical protein
LCEHYKFNKWEKPLENEKPENKKKRNYLLLLAIGLFIVSLPFFWPIYFFTGVISVQALYAAIFDNRSDFFSTEIGKEVHLAPFTVVTKMNNYGGWRDEYNYIFANPPNDANSTRLNQYRTFKVIDEKTRVSWVNSSKKVCIIEDIKNRNLKASIYCQDIPHINEATKIISALTDEINFKGKSYVASTADRRDSNLKSILKINRFIVFEINSEKELKELVAPNNDQNDSYEYIMRLSHLIPLKTSEVFDEYAQSKLFIHHYGGHWSEELYGYSSFESYIQNNMIPADMENWIMTNHSNPRDRWAIRSILSVVQQALFVEKKIDGYRAAEFVKGLEQSKVCVAKYYSSSNARRDIDEALEKFLEIKERRIAFMRIKDRVDSAFHVDPRPCHDFFPPVICGGEEKCESWTR